MYHYYTQQTVPSFHPLMNSGLDSVIIHNLGLYTLSIMNQTLEFDDLYLFGNRQPPVGTIFHCHQCDWLRPNKEKSSHAKDDISSLAAIS